MTTYVQARDTLATYINSALTTNKPALKVFWENTTHIDLNTVGTEFVLISINFHDAFNSTMNDTPLVQYTGEVTFRIFYKEGQGTRNAYELFDFFTNLMRFQVLSGVQLDTPNPGRKTSKDGWAMFDLNAPFSFRS